MNKEKHKMIQSGQEWADSVDPQPVRQHMSFLMQVGKDTESTSEKVMENYNSVRKEIQINTEQGLAEILNNIKHHTTLLVVEDRRNNKAQFD